MSSLLFLLYLLPIYWQVDGQRMCRNITGNPILSAGVSADDIRNILDIHNRLRDQVAAGNVTARDGNQLPSAADIPVMNWDSNLAAAAQALTDTCVRRHGMPNPELYGTDYGQNLYQSWTSGRPQIDWIAATMDWFNEVRDFPVGDRSPYRPARSGPAVGHFTQLIWARTNRIGCGYTQFTDPDIRFQRFPNTGVYACNYGPAGNVYSPDGSIFFEIYRSGQPCSTCICSSIYTNLCAN